MTEDLHDAIEMGWIEWVRQLIEGGADVNAADRRGVTPLHAAIEHGELDIARLLIETGADVNERDDIDDTALHWACTYARPKAVRLLFSHGGDANTRNMTGSTPLDMVLQLSPDNPAREEILDLFREYAPEAVLEKFCEGPSVVSHN
jgi:ankyrin repeat protein